MSAIAHRLDHLPEGFAALLRRLVYQLFAGFSASWDKLMDRNAARGQPGADDIFWDDGEPEHLTDKL